MEAFKTAHIYKEISDVEEKERVFLDWLPTLRHHTYDGQRRAPGAGKGACV